MKMFNKYTHCLKEQFVESGKATFRISMQPQEAAYEMQITPVALLPLEFQILNTVNKCINA